LAKSEVVPFGINTITSLAHDDIKAA